MEASSSTQVAAPATPSHSSLLPALSPNEITPAPIHPIYSHPPPSHSNRMMPPAHAQARTPTPAHGHGQGHPHPPPQAYTPTPQRQTHPPGSGKLFSSVMGQTPGQQGGTRTHVPASPTPVGGAAGGGGVAKVYASVYSGIPVYEAMVRGISVMRRTGDSWVNATQILKVAGVPKGTRTKILEKEIAAGTHEKVQGGYGKYQGTWIPFQRGQELAQQYGVASYLAPIFDFVPSSSNLTALPIARHDGTPDASKPNTHLSAAYNPAFGGQPPGPSGSGRVAVSPFSSGPLAPPLPHAPWTGPNGEVMAYQPHPGQPMAYHDQPPPNMYYHPQPPHAYGTGTPTPGEKRRHPDAGDMSVSRGGEGSGPSGGMEANGLGLPSSHSEVYLDQYGQPHPIHQGMYAGPANGGFHAAKRIKIGDTFDDANGDTAGVTLAEDEDYDEEAEDDLRASAPLPKSMRLSLRPLRPKANAAAANARSRLLSLFSTEGPVDIRAELDYNAEDELDFDIDMVIDDQGHTALHWAASLAKLNLVDQLIQLGADIHRGNFAGETPLIRSVLTNNHADSGTFPQLLEYLSPAIKTLDHSYRSVIHHAVLVAGVAGRAASARSYLTSILEWVAKEQRQGSSNSNAPSLNAGHEGTNGSSPTTFSLKNLVDIQDLHGDTALNLAARVGNKGLVRLLLDAGADKAKTNKLGLKPVDFGVEIEALTLTAGEAVVSSLKSEVNRPERQSRDVQKNIAAIFESINDTFSSELLAKQTRLNTTEQNVRHATRSLAGKRQQIARAQASLAELEQLALKSENIKRALGAAPALDWSGRTRTASGSPSRSGSGPAFQPVDVVLSQQSPGSIGEEAPIPTEGSIDAVVELRRMKLWEERIAGLLKQQLDSLEGESMDKEVKYRRLVSLCTKVPVDKVDGMLEHLNSALESDGPTVDVTRITSVMSRMKAER